MPDAAANVAGIYAMLRDVLSGTTFVPDFNHAVLLTRLVDAVPASSKRRVRQQNDGWRADLKAGSAFEHLASTRHN